MHTRHHDGDTGTSRGVHPAGTHVSDCNCDDDRDWRRHEQGRHSRSVATASGLATAFLVPYGAPVGAAPTFQTVTALPGYQYGAPQEVQYGTRCSVARNVRQVALRLNTPA